MVNDSLTSRKHVERRILSMGFADIELARDGKEAVDLFNDRAFDLIITDYNMPQMDGAM